MQDLGNSIYYELDCIIHLVQDGSHSTCHYYRLCRDRSESQTAANSLALSSHDTNYPGRTESSDSTDSD